jgi:hypothetical protein
LPARGARDATLPTRAPAGQATRRVLMTIASAPTSSDIVEFVRALALARRAREATVASVRRDSLLPRLPADELALHQTLVDAQAATAA